MNYERSNEQLKNNIVYSAVYQILVFLVPIITIPYVTRIFDAAQIGEYSLSLSIASFFIVISQFGIETYGTREIASVDSILDRNTLYFKLLSIQFTVSIIMFILYNLIFFIVIDVPNKELFLAQSFLILINITDISWYFIGIEEIKKIIFRNALMKVFTTLSIFIFITNKDQLVLYALLNVIGMFIGNLTMIITSRKYIDYNKIKFSLSKEHTIGSFKLLIPRLLDSSYRSIESTILTILTSSASLGIYAQAKKIDELIFSVINSAINALSPRMSYFVSKNDKTNLNIFFNKGIEYSSMFSIVFISGILAVSDDFADFFFGDGYEMVGPVLSILSISLLFLPIISLLNRAILIPFNKDKEFSISILIILATGILFNLILSTLYGAIGAALTYNITQIFTFIYLIYIVQDIIDVKYILKNITFSIFCIIINVYTVINISNIIIVENSILSFFVFGLISFIINFLLFTTLNYIKKHLIS